MSVTAHHNYVFLDSKSHRVIEELAEQNTDAFLEIGDTVHARLRNKGNRFYTIVDMEEGDVIRVIVQKRPMHYTEMIQLVVILGLGALIFWFAFKFFTN